VAYGVHEFSKARPIPASVDDIWALNPVLDEVSRAGKFLRVRKSIISRV
jgi:hypothetical protein